VKRIFHSNNFNSDNRVEIITMKNSFHGRTIATITATGQEKYQKGLSPLLPGIKYCEYNNIDSLKGTINDNTCAIFIEAIQGEGGIVPADVQYLQQVRKLCDDNNIVLIIDEVQTGIGRSGKMFAYEHFNIKPDIVTMAKGLGSGIVVGAFAVNDKVAKGFEPGDHASTFGGNALACTAVNITLDMLSNGGILDNVVEQGKYLNKRLNELKDKYDCIVDVRGMGLMQGIEINIPVPNVVSKCLEKGLLLVGAGANVIRFVPPLVISSEEIDECIKIIDEAFSEIIAGN
jgi:acetylornithine/succinyldiaminopimelate/putrescine aminotransferase